MKVTSRQGVDMPTNQTRGKVDMTEIVAPTGANTHETAHADAYSSSGSSPPGVTELARLVAALTAEERTQFEKLSRFLNATASPGEGEDAEGYRVELVQFASIEAKRTDWMWEGRIPRGMLSLLIGTEGLGKSALTLRLAALMSRGSLPGDFEDDPSDVALVTVEDDPGRVMRPRLEAAGADLDRVYHFKLSKHGNDAGLNLPRDAGRLGRQLASADVRLVIIDPLATTLDPRLNSYKDTDVREALTPLVAAAAEHDFAVLGVLHTNKTKTTDARERAMGSVGWRQIVRSALYLGVDPDDPEGKAGDNRVIAHDKCNVGRLARSLRMRLEEATVEVEGRPAKLPRAEVGEECDYRANDLMAAEAGVDREKIGGKLGEAIAMLNELLAEGPVAVEVLKEEAGRRDIGWRTVETAKGSVGAKAGHAGGTAAWTWELPLAF